MIYCKERSNVEILYSDSDILVCIKPTGIAVEGTKPDLCALLIPEEEAEELALYVGELSDRYDQALEKYPVLLGQLTACLKTGEPLGEDFAPNFG